ncbi:MAG TPA: hypothetical protein VIX17_12425 [Pyrinomonadaceae bacterium]
MRKTHALTVIIAIILSAFISATAQDPAPQQPTEDDKAKEKAALEKNAYRLLDQVIDEAQTLRLPENRVHIQISAADLIWDRNQTRARSLFSLASEAIVEMMRSTPAPTNQRGFPNQRWFGLRQELVLTAGRHDAQLAYQLLAATKSQSPPASPQDARNPRMMLNSDENLEQTLLGRVAALDPKFAAQNAEQMMEKGQFPRSLGEVINQLQRQDADAASKLADKTVKRIQSANLLTNNDAGMLAQTLISLGPRLPASADTTSSTDTKAQPQQSRGPVLDTSLYTDLLSSVIDAALKVNAPTQNAPRTVQGRGARGLNAQLQNNQPPQPTDEQIELNNGRRLLAGLQTTLPAIDQYLPSKASAVRQKLTEFGFGDQSRANFGQAMNVLQQPNPTADALLQAAQAAPAPLQSRLYGQAASKAMDDGNTDQARQIATDHLQGSQRDAMIQRIDFREMVKKSDGLRLDEIRQSVSRLANDSDKISLLLQIANDLQKDNPKAQLQVLEEARTVVNHRAANYDQFEDQLRVARAFSAVDTARSFEVIETGIGQLNELLSAAAVLSGFEVNIFRDGEMNVTQGGSGLNSTIGRYGQELALLAKTDFERSETLAGRFQFTEPRIIARLSIIQGALGVQATAPNTNVIRNFGGGTFVGRPN